MEPVREATGFAKYVKEKYKEFKKPGVKHAEVMRQISSQYLTVSQEEKQKYWSNITDLILIIFIQIALYFTNL